MITLSAVRNPFYCYIIGFSIVLFIYLWGWSELYPILSIDVLVFLLTTFLTAYLLGRSQGSKFEYENICVDQRNLRRFLFVCICYVIEFVHAGGVPLVMIASGTGYDYRDFGIPTFHILVQTLGPFYTLYLFHQYIVNKKKSLLIYAVVLLCMSILIVNRGSVVMTCISCLLLSLRQRPLLKKRRVLTLLIGFSLFFYSFGYVGNLRSFKENEDLLLEMAKSTDAFQKNIVPNEYFWLYLYAASPLANFQEVVDTARTHRYDFWRYVNNELIPDIIARRFDRLETDPDYNNRMDYTIAPFLTVGTMYYDSFIRMGWWGPAITFVYYMTFILLYVKLINHLGYTRKYRQTAIVIICTMSIFNVFDNMTRGAGLLIQLIYPFIFGILDKIHVTNDAFSMRLKLKY